MCSRQLNRLHTFFCKGPHAIFYRLDYSKKSIRIILIFIIPSPTFTRNRCIPRIPGFFMSQYPRIYPLRENFSISSKTINLILLKFYYKCFKTLSLMQNGQHKNIGVKKCFYVFICNKQINAAEQKVAFRKQ